MVELVDSNSKDKPSHSDKCFLPNENPDELRSKNCYLNRTEKIYEKLKNYVDIWEIGNEINGDWFGGKQSNNDLRRRIVVAQIKAAYDFFETEKGSIARENEKPENRENQKKNPQTAITYFFNDAGDKDNIRHDYSEPADSLIVWLKNGGTNFPNVDYVLISYYPDNNFYTPAGAGVPVPIELTVQEWIDIFKVVKKDNFGKNTKFGIGEMGTHCNFQNCEDPNSCSPVRDGHECNRSRGCCISAQEDIIRKDYINLNKQILTELKKAGLTEPSLNGNDFVGGYFNWYYAEDVIRLKNARAITAFQDAYEEFYK